MEDFAQLVERHQAMVLRTLARLTGDRDGLEDMAQEVFLRLFRALPNFRNQAQITTFIYRIVVNVVNDEFSRRRKARLSTPLAESEHILEDRSPTPAQELDRAELQEAVEVALQQLDPYDRAILTLHYQEGRTYDEIAEILSAPIGTVKTHLYRARQRLKSTLKEWTTCETK